MDYNNRCLTSTAKTAIIFEISDGAVIGFVFIRVKIIGFCPAIKALS